MTETYYYVEWWSPWHTGWCYVCTCKDAKHARLECKRAQKKEPHIKFRAVKIQTTIV